MMKMHGVNSVKKNIQKSTRKLHHKLLIHCINGVRRRLVEGKS
jgi:hypothetical protein